MAEVIRLLCDKCGAEEGVRPYRVSTPETGLTKAVALDLCDDCASPLLGLASTGRTVSTPKKRVAPQYQPGRGGEAIRARIYSQEEIDEIEEQEEATEGA